MKYVYTGKELNRSIPDNVGHRWLAGIILGAISTVMLICAVTAGDWGSAMGFYALRLLLGGIGFLLIYFALRTQKAILRATQRTPEDILENDEKDPFYSAQCGHCSVLLDYQRADLAFRPWFIKGYVECPCCGKPIRHDKQKNVFVPHRYPGETQTQ